MPTNENPNQENDITLISFGETIKAYREGNQGIVEAPGVRFSNPNKTDLENEYFDAKTYYGQHAGDGMDATLNHRLPIVTNDAKSNEFLKLLSSRRFKNPVKAIMGESGIVARHVLDLADEYEAFVFDLAEKGAFRWSSGTAGHLTVREQVGKSTYIKEWPIIEWAYTPTAADPNLPKICAVKNLSDYASTLKALIPETEQDTVSDNEATGGDNIIIPETGEQKMSEDTSAALLEELKSIRAEMAEMKEERQKEAEQENRVKSSGIAAPVVTDDESDRALKGNPFKTAGDFLRSVALSASGNVDKRLNPLKSIMGGEGPVYNMPGKIAGSLKAPTGLGELISNDGGFLVGTDQSQTLLQRVYETGQVLNRARMQPISGNSNSLTIPAIDETSRATGSRQGGVRAYWVPEAGSITASNPEFRQIRLQLQKLAALVYVTDELLQDSAALGAWVNNNVPDELNFTAENALIRGTGAGQPLGVLNSGCLVSVAAEAGQAATTIVAENIIKMWARMWARSRGNAVWYINQDIEPQLYQLNLPVGTGGQLVYMPPGGLSASPYGTLFGRPVIPVEYASTLGTVGDIILADMSQYLVATKGGMMAESSIHVRFVNDETAFRFIMRMDGQPVWDTALTPFQGTNTQSPFIALATRS